MIKDKELSRRIAALRKEKRLSLKEAASAIGIKYPTYTKYEYGNYPSRKNLDKILNFYGCSKTWLLTGEGSMFSGEDLTNHDQPKESEPVEILGNINEEIDPELFKIILTAVREFVEHRQGKFGDPDTEIAFFLWRLWSSSEYKNKITKESVLSSLEVITKIGHSGKKEGYQAENIYMAKLLAWGDRYFK